MEFQISNAYDGYFPLPYNEVLIKLKGMDVVATMKGHSALYMISKNIFFAQPTRDKEKKQYSYSAMMNFEPPIEETKKLFKITDDFKCVELTYKEPEKYIIAADDYGIAWPPAHVGEKCGIDVYRLVEEKDVVTYEYKKQVICDYFISKTKNYIIYVDGSKVVIYDPIKDEVANMIERTMKHYTARCGNILEMTNWDEHGHYQMALPNGKIHPKINIVRPA